MGDKRSAKSPLLYIHQPHVHTPKVSMQSHYMTPKKQQDNQNKQSNRAVKRPSNRNHFTKQVAEDESDNIDSVNRDDYDKQNNEDEDADYQQKKFKDMTLLERVHYFLNPPKYAPVMRCEIRTTERKHRGKIVDYQDEQVYMQTGRRTTPTNIPFNTINEIRMIGF
ncbi:hypothetical protein GCM10007063_17040 [Lentibacillus kapialis]|uniref:Spore coat protein CotO n=1 Tax=Lentibacillus kapialis TaxID=340214 RepID=A0A917PWF5_9BACI|nr:CotO family spore coat protein [Lentibacillus kapialis]GGJ95116.1 hypothetical protein GCM10007063_17040 [Lentibacillus kapialis]